MARRDCRNGGEISWDAVRGRGLAMALVMAIKDALARRLSCVISRAAFSLCLPSKGRACSAWKSIHPPPTNGDYHDQTKHRFRAWPLGRWIMLQQVDPNAPDRVP